MEAIVKTVLTELGYDSLKGYKTGSLINFIKQTQSKNWKKLEEIHGAITEEYFLKMVEKEILDSKEEIADRVVELWGQRYFDIYEDSVIEILEN